MHGMDDRDRDELAELRARAYGPAGRETLDAAGWARLHELESAVRAPEPVLESPAPERPVRDVDPAEPHPVRDLDPAPEHPAQDPAPATAQRVPTRMRWLWAASVVAAAVIGAGAASLAASARPADPPTGALPETVLQPNPGLSVPVSFWGSTGSTTVYEYYGLWVLRPEGGVRGTPADCLLIADRDDIDLRTTAITGPVTGGCTAGAFPAAAQFTVTDDAPDRLLARHPAGSGLRFVADDDTVGVFVAPAPPSPAPR